MTSHAPLPLQQKVAGNFVLALGTSVWATHFLVTDELLKTWDPYFITTGRLLSATLFLMIAYLVQTRGRGLRGVPWKHAVILGVLGIAVTTNGLTLSVKYAGPVPAAIVAAASPIVAAFVARIGFGIRLSMAILLGAVVAVGGGVVAAVGGSPGGIGEMKGGELIILGAIVVFTWYSLGAQRWMAGISQLGITAITMAIGGLAMLALLPLLVAAGIAHTHLRLDPTSIGFILYLGAGPASFALFTWHWGVSRIGVTVASIYNNLVPVVVVVIRMIQGEPPKTAHLIGGAMIIAGVLVAQLLPSGRTRHARPAT